MSEAVSVQHDVVGHQFETTVDGHRAYLAYMDLGKQTLDIYRTFVPNALRGRGIAAALTEQALAYAEDAGYSVIPSCSYVERYMVRRQRSQVKSKNPRPQKSRAVPGFFVRETISLASALAVHP